MLPTFTVEYEKHYPDNAHHRWGKVSIFTTLDLTVSLGIY